jgi:predicted aspartyl protease
MLSLPSGVIRQLGLKKSYDRRVRSAIGIGTAAVYDVVQVTIQGRECRVEVMEVPDGPPALVGQLVLEPLDFVVDMKNRRLIGNPEHNGELVLDLL